MKLLELLNLANAAYPDGDLANYYDEETGKRKDGSGDGLAQFVVLELSETFTPNDDSVDQLENAAERIRTAIADLEAVATKLENAVWSNDDEPKGDQ
jgi:hypothetical protein